MVLAEIKRLRRHLRLILTWVLTLALVVVYLSLPDGEKPKTLETPTPVAVNAEKARKLDVLEVSPADADPGDALVVSFEGAEDESKLKVFAGREELEVLTRRPGAVVARLPSEIEPGRAKIRISDGHDRSKPYDIRIKLPNRRKPFRTLIGGFALLVFGIGVFARGVREAVGFRGAEALARVARRGPAALGIGAVAGALVQSTTAAAGLLAGLVTSSLLAVGPAAIAFLGAQLGAATAPLVTGLIDPREGLMVVAIAVLWLGLARDRLGTALGRLALGAGLIAFSMQVMRPAFEPFTSDPALLPVIQRLQAGDLLGTASAALLGAALVGALQGPAPVLLLVIGLAQTTAHWDLRTSLAVMSGSGLGAAVAALLTTPAGPACRRLAKLHLLLGLASTLLVASTLDVWIALTERVVGSGVDEPEWGKRVLLPNFAAHLGTAFALSQLAAAALFVPVVPLVARWLERLRPDAGAAEIAKVGDAAGVVRSRMLRALGAQQEAIESVRELVVYGRRRAGSSAEHRLADARAEIQELLAGAVRALPETGEGRRLARSAFGCFQLERSLEALLAQGERLTDGRIVASSGGSGVLPLHGGEEATLREMHALLVEGLTAIAESLRAKAPLDFEAATAREIRMNGLEARARAALLNREQGPATIRDHLHVLELVDAYETAGNQLYRLAEALGDAYAPTLSAGAN